MPMKFRNAARAMLCTIERPSCLDRVPEWVEDYLRKCPRSPDGVH